MSVSALWTLAEFKPQLLDMMRRHGYEGAVLRIRFRAVGTGDEQYPQVVATQQTIVLVFRGASYRPVAEHQILTPDKCGYVMLNLGFFRPDGKRSFFVAHPALPGLQPVRFGIAHLDQIHVVVSLLPVSR